MKCEACKYEYNVKYDEDGEEILIGNEQFISSELRITINQKQGAWDCDRLSVETVWICPKCGALKVEI
jgi:rubredoxin